MKVVYLSNFFNHHQKPLADALYEKTLHQYMFVEMEEMPDSFVKTGYSKYKEPYVLRYSKDTKGYIEGEILNADVVICGEAPTRIIRERVRQGRLVFRDDERRYKSLFKYIKWPIYTYDSIVYNRGYLLSASAYGSRDYVLSGMKPQRCFKWGYFPELRRYDDVEMLMRKKSNGKRIKILWACRMIGWKHPEMVVKLAKKLKADGVDFEVKMAGRGEKEIHIKELIAEYGLDDRVFLVGPQKQERLRDLMEESQIFLATSDQNEGWGATINESMNSACAVVASHAIGAVPYLIEHGKNGLVFKSKDVDSLYSKVKWLIEHPDEISILGRNAYYTIRNVWNADVASTNLLELVQSIRQGIEPQIPYGPCSQALIFNHTDYRQLCKENEKKTASD